MWEKIISPFLRPPSAIYPEPEVFSVGAFPMEERFANHRRVMEQLV